MDAQFSCQNQHLEGAVATVYPRRRERREKEEEWPPAPGIKTRNQHAFTQESVSQFQQGRSHALPGPREVSYWPSVNVLNLLNCLNIGGWGPGVLLGSILRPFQYVVLHPNQQPQNINVTVTEERNLFLLFCMAGGVTRRIYVQTSCERQILKSRRGKQFTQTHKLSGGGIMHFNIRGWGLRAQQPGGESERHRHWCHHRQSRGHLSRRLLSDT